MFSNHTNDAWRRRLRIEIRIPRFQIAKQYSQVTSSACSTVARGGAEADFMEPLYNYLVIVFLL